MSDNRKNPPNVWAKSLAKLLAGDDRCWFKGWYQANHWTKREELTAEDRARLDGYQVKHEAIAERRAAELKAEDYVLKCEDDAAFKVHGHDRCPKCGVRRKKTPCESCGSEERSVPGPELAGKPDIVAMRDDEALVVDAKSGKRKDADAWQVLVYMFALPLSWLGETFKVRSEVEYQDRRETVRPLTVADRQEIGDGVQRLAKSTPPAATPSKWECGFCSLECPVRWREEDHAGDGSRYF